MRLEILADVYVTDLCRGSGDYTFVTFRSLRKSKGFDLVLRANEFCFFLLFFFLMIFMCKKLLYLILFFFFYNNLSNDIVKF